MRLTPWHSDRCCALGGRLTAWPCFLGGDNDRAASLDSIWYGFRHQPLPIWQGLRRARTDMYCLPRPKDDYRTLAESGDEPPQWIWRALNGHVDSSAGQLGFGHQLLLTLGLLDGEHGSQWPFSFWVPPNSSAELPHSPPVAVGALQRPSPIWTHVEYRSVLVWYFPISNKYNNSILLARNIVTSTRLHDCDPVEWFDLTTSLPMEIADPRGEPALGFGGTENA